MKDSHEDPRYLHKCDYMTVVCYQCVSTSIHVLRKNIKELEERIIDLEHSVRDIKYSLE